MNPVYQTRARILLVLFAHSAHNSHHNSRDSISATSQFHSMLPSQAGLWALDGERRGCCLALPALGMLPTALGMPARLALPHSSCALRHCELKPASA